ncbi:hypothetical protein SAY86_001358 [Trapa natans]|uniref:C3H1-type domain-containing protein n=1 Tax=Trapa natans TaxID=22666 RepID=A0AAN7MVW7_TRANT|nr:hypothetical protein SAY86_001358 [Trapa natans]
MDGYEATRMVFSRIKGLDPVNASKIMGLLLIQDHGDKEMIRLAFGPDTLLRSLILKARKDLGLPSNSPPTPSTPSFPSSFLSTDPISISRPNSRIISSCSRVSSPPSWADLSGGLQSADELSDISNGSSGGVLSGSSSSFPGNGSSDSSMVDGSQLQDQLSCLNDSSPLQLEMLSSPTGWCSPMHHLRSCSVNDMCLGSEDPSAEIGWKPCLFYARGFCKNGSSCRFLHGGIVGFPSTAELMGQCHELLRSKPVQQQQRLASLSQLMGGDSFAFPYSPKSLNLDFQHQQNDPRRVAAALTMGEDIYKHHERSRFERKDFLMSGMASPASRQIYLTFPADSIFKEEDVSNYFR